MFPFWDVAISPVLTSMGARRIVEIGALRGETTVRMLESLGPQAELHVIDPVPVITIWRASFGGMPSTLAVASCAMVGARLVRARDRPPHHDGRNED